MDGCEPCSCILFSQSQIIVGSNKFYRIDLRQFTIEGKKRRYELTIVTFQEVSNVFVNFTTVMNLINTRKLFKEKLWHCSCHLQFTENDDYKTSSMIF